MNTLYLVVLLLAIFVPWFRPTCRRNKVFPAVMNFATLLFLINAAKHWWVHAKNYYRENDEEQKALEEKGIAPRNVERMIFDKQMDYYLRYQTIVAVVQILI